MDSQGFQGTALLVVLALAALLIYFLPSIIAANREHPNATAIFLLNLLLGWTLLGWVAALVWSATAFQPPAAAAPRAP